MVEDYGHKYPYDWRTKKPTIFRATDQWFASVEGFRDAALAAVDTVSNLKEGQTYLDANDETIFSLFKRA
jgi:isoleucyl-tRNA synthetase